MTVWFVCVFVVVLFGYCSLSRANIFPEKA